ncbi:MarR family winged helix-turn-helix transcriptional regulator [Gallaecimonas mangrovi]|uniref:MarR family winged helix-turn-helix transcriptional regulator n=1 Tax=Gallaecimonas mangrovi TaxID=2291597 RepID=UPI000E206A2A|nr:MarR family transcriptional regulator [Gallaecimonas mangrovi]
MQPVDEVLMALRRIIRAIDLHSRQLTKATSLTGPQLMLLRTIDENPGDTTRSIAKMANLSQATVTSIIDRLEAKELVCRQRSSLDKRKVELTLTEQGKQAVAKAPALLQNAFIKQFDELELWEQTLILSSLQRVASMMDAEGIDASPMLTLEQHLASTKGE